MAARYGISALSGLLASARASAGQDEISVAVLGRFKAGKSSFLNHFIGRGILPVGVVPVTAVVTEIRYGARDEARVHHRDGRDPEVPLDQIGSYISEKENPENTKQVGLITVELPELRRFRGLQFVDTPGLESALSHNTQTSLDWLPNVGLALVAVSVDPPLSQRDIDLLKSLYQYTPKVAVLLTKADLLSEPELAEVVEYVRTQLAKNFSGTPQVFPYSTKPGFERFREALEAELVGGTLERFAEERESILLRKMDTLLRECGDYLALSLKSAEMVQSERQALRQQVIGEKEIVDEVKSAIRLVVQHAAAGTRSMVEQPARDAPERPGAQRCSKPSKANFRNGPRALPPCFPRSKTGWRAPCATSLPCFPSGNAVRSWRPCTKYGSRHSARCNNFGIACRIAPCGRSACRCAPPKPRSMSWSPRTPDIRIGRVFDRNWELLSPILPVWMIRAVVRRHFARTISYLVYQNLSRLSTQWEESINGALWGVEKEARRRLDELMGTVERLVESGGNEQAPQLRADLERMETARKSLAAGTAG